MNTPSPADPRQPQRIRHPLKFRQAKVVSVTALSPHMLRVVVQDEALTDFASAGFDDHVKLFFPDPETGQIHLPRVGEDGTPVRDPDAPVLARDYTPRHFDTDKGELTLDFAVHEAGPATGWAQSAKPSDTLGIGGPRGSFVIPLAFDGYVLIGDDTALPAIARRLEELPANAKALVVAEVDGPEDELALDTRADARIHWVHRNGAQPGEPRFLLEALQGLSLPQGDVHVWVAAEASVARALRAQFIEAHGVNPKWLKAAAYWKRGQIAVHETIE